MLVLTNGRDKLIEKFALETTVVVVLLVLVEMDCGVSDTETTAVDFPFSAWIATELGTVVFGVALPVVDEVATVETAVDTLFLFPDGVSLTDGATLTDIMGTKFMDDNGEIIAELFVDGTTPLLEDTALIPDTGVIRPLTGAVAAVDVAKLNVTTVKALVPDV